MGKVYANGREVLSKGDHGKVVGAFPDVCNSPPGPPTGPVPVPYTLSSSARDLKKGSKRVRIEGKPVGLRDQSYLATSPLGNEPATKSFGGNLVSHQVTGKTYFGSWSLDVEIEGKGVLRHHDLATSNHGSYPGGTPALPNLSEVHQLALGRVTEGQCPCCGKDTCAAAFKPGEEPLSQREALGLVPGRENFNAKRYEEYRVMKAMKKTSCTCNGEVFPSPPCDVFREPNDTVRTREIEGQWDRYRDKYHERYATDYGRRLLKAPELIPMFLSVHPPAQQAAAKAAMKLPKSQRRLTLAPLYEQAQVDAHKLARINHLTPKEYGGCPRNHDNLQPQQTLCLDCQRIDQYMTDNW